MDADRTPTRRMLAAVAAATVIAGAAVVALDADRTPERAPAIATGAPKRPLSATSGLMPGRRAPAVRCPPACRGGGRAEPAEPCAATCR